MKSIKMYLIYLSILTGSILQTQAQSFEQGQSAFSVGYGFPSFTRTIFNLSDAVSDVESSVIGPVYLKYEYAMSDVIGFGINAAYTHGSASYEANGVLNDTIIYNTSFDYDAYSILARINFHFGESDVFDPYAGIGLGYRNTTYTFDSGDPDFDETDFTSFIHMGMDMTIGTRVYFSENIGMYGEVGLGKSIFQVGLIAKF